MTEITRPDSTEGFQMTNIAEPNSTEGSQMETLPETWFRRAEYSSPSFTLPPDPLSQWTITRMCRALRRHGDEYGRLWIPIMESQHPRVTFETILPMLGDSFALKNAKDHLMVRSLYLRPIFGYGRRVWVKTDIGWDELVLTTLTWHAHFEIALPLMLVAIPILAEGVVSRFSAEGSTWSQRIFIIMWFLGNIGGALWGVSRGEMKRYEARLLKSGSGSRSMVDWNLICVGFLIIAVGVSAYVVIIQMIISDPDFGTCS